MEVLICADVQSVHSVDFAEVTWYGSLHSVVEISGGDEARISDGDSCWSSMSSSQESEGLTAVYWFKNKINSTDVSFVGNELKFPKSPPPD